MAAGGFFPVADARPSVTLLDDLSGHEFEDAVAALFRAHGYEDVAVADRVADEGRDVLVAVGPEQRRHGVLKLVAREVIQERH